MCTFTKRISTQGLILLSWFVTKESGILHSWAIVSLFAQTLYFTLCFWDMCCLKKLIWISGIEFYSRLISFWHTKCRSLSFAGFSFPVTFFLFLCILKWLSDKKWVVFDTQHNPHLFFGPHFVINWSVTLGHGWLCLGILFLIHF